MGDEYLLLIELVNNATHVLLRCADSPTTTEDYVDYAPLAIYRQILEYTDAFTVLAIKGCAQPAIPILRSVLEAYLSLEYILENDNSYKSRSLQRIANQLKKIKVNKKFDPDTAEGKEFRALIDKDKIIKEYPSFPKKDINKKIDKLNNILDEDIFEDIRLEYERLKQNNNTNLKWYSLFGGPQNLEDLAAFLNHHIQYDFLYRRWSLVSHVQDFSTFSIRTHDGEIGLRGIRDDSKLFELMPISTFLIFNSTKMILAKFIPEEVFSDYQKKIQPKMDEIARRRNS